MSAYIKNLVCILFVVLTGPTFAFIAAEPVTYQLQNMTGSKLVVKPEATEGMLTTYAVPDKKYHEWIKEDKWYVPDAILDNDGNFDETYYAKEIKDKSVIEFTESMTEPQNQKELGKIKYAWHSGGYVFVTYIEFKIVNPNDPLDTHDCKARVIMKAALLQSWTYGMELAEKNKSLKTNSTQRHNNVAGVSAPRTTFCNISVHYKNPTIPFPIDHVKITLEHDYKIF